MKARAVPAILLATVLAATAAGGEVFDDETAEFLRRPDTAALARMGAIYRGRTALLDTVAREQLDRMGIADLPQGVTPVAAYLELYFNAGAYLDRPVLLVTEEPMLKAVSAYLDEDTKEKLAQTHRLPPAALVDDEAVERIMWSGRTSMDDYRRAAATVPSLDEALEELSGKGELRLPLQRLAMRYEAWLGTGLSAAACVGEGKWTSVDEILAGTYDDEHKEVAEAWRGLRDAWRRRDPPAIEQAASELLDIHRERAGARYPSPLMQTAEIAYNSLGQFTFTWIGFALATVLLIPATVRQGGRLRPAGLAVMALSALLLGVGFVIRWAISGRGAHMPPVLNQFEAVTASALLAAIVALVLEMRWKRNAFALAGGFYAAVAMLCGFWMPGRMGADIAATHGLLDSPLMAAHVGVIIVGHAAVGMTFAISLVYLAAAVASRRWTGWRLPADIDRCNLIVAHVATWTLTLGIVLGAAWGDVAWGRWWGWDAKETWSLITLLVYLAVIHVRLVTPPRRRGILTAIGCIVGTLVMLFNWIVVNYYLTELHGYA